MQEILKKEIEKAIKNLDIEGLDFVVEHPGDLDHGDYSSNVAMVYAKKVGKNPKVLAEEIVAVLLPLLVEEGVGGGGLKPDHHLALSGTPPQKGGEDYSIQIQNIEKIEVANPGFINFYLSREFFTDSIKEIIEKGENWGKNEILKDKKVMIEYTQPNPFKPFHIGHLMSNAIGESISRILEYSGAKVVRANYQGDVGLHVGKAIYGLLKKGLPKENLSVSEKAQYIGECYVFGSDIYENDENIKNEIDEINKKVYDHSDEEINKIYDWGREVTLEAFEEIYKILDTKFNYYFFESDMAKVGEKIVRANIGKVFTESEGAIVFKAEEYDPKLHTRVFITSSNLPLYETKEIGLTITKFEKENPDLSIVTTAIEQAEYMKVVAKAISIMHREYESKMKHVTHGMMRLATGKMSSRKGNVVTGESLLFDSMDVIKEKVKDREFNEEEKKNISEIVGVSALKYSILKSSLGSDIVYDFEKSISFEGDSGPYLQYTAVRAKAILNKAEEENINIDYKNIPEEITVLEKMLYQFEEVVKHSYLELEPHYVSTYLTELASEFNSFYGNTKILIVENNFKAYHIALVKTFYITIKNGLYLLGIKTPEKM